MPCLFPLQAKFSVRADGKKHIVFSEANARLFRLGISPSGDNNLSLPCGRCMGCKLERSRQWALRMVHEARFYDDNCFVTLTFDDEHLADMCPNGSLCRKHVQDFLKRLRQKFSDRIVRVFYCGEYGDRLSRPHYHLCLFNLDFDDKVFFSSVMGFKYFNSAVLSAIWPYGHAVVTDFSFETAAYVARYCTKKITGAAAKDHYSGRVPEFCGMSLKPGIGHLWYQSFGKTDLLPTDTCVSRGVICKPPRYYDKLREREDPEAFSKAKVLRAERAKLNADDNSYRRLVAKEKCMDARLRLLVRKLEN